MTTLRHPNIHPPLEIEVADEAVEAHLLSGWVHPEPESTPDTEPTGEDHEQEQA